MSIYLHELVDAVAGKTDEYQDSVARNHGTAAARRGQSDALLGLWSASEATGTWPLAVNVWHYGGWDGVAANLARQFDPTAQDPELKKWWLGNLALRTGGFDRIVESTDYSPDIASLKRRGVRGKLFLHSIIDVTPGAVSDFLAAFGGEAVAACEGAGATFVGAYRVRLRDREAITLLAFREPGDLARFQESWYDAATALGRWRRREDEWVRGKRALLLRARYFLTSPWHP